MYCGQSTEAELVAISLWKYINCLNIIIVLIDYPLRLLVVARYHLFEHKHTARHIINRYSNILFLVLFMVRRRRNCVKPWLDVGLLVCCPPHLKWIQSLKEHCRGRHCLYKCGKQGCNTKLQFYSGTSYKQASGFSGTQQQEAGGGWSW